jgi:ATP-dependent 26S proteasome regulatory subunit
MSDFEAWEQQNTKYLSAAVSWLRACLEAHAVQEPTFMSLAQPPPPASTSKPGWFKSIWHSEPRIALRTTPLLAADPGLGANEQVKEASAVLEAAEAEANPAPALVMLAQRLGLSHFEQSVLLLCVAMELDTRIPNLCARAQDDSTHPYPTFALALTLFDNPAWDALTPDRPLRHWRLIEITQPGSQPLTTSALRADERIVNYIKGLNYLDDRLLPLLSPLEIPQGSAKLPASQQLPVDSLVPQLAAQAAQSTSFPVVQLLGSDPGSKQLVVAAVSTAMGLHPYRLTTSALSGHGSELETFVRLWQRESLLLPVVLYLETESESVPAAECQGVLNRFLSRCQSLIFVDTRELATGITRPTISVEIGKPTPPEQQAEWTAALGADSAAVAASLSGQFNLNLPTIRTVVSNSAAELPGDTRNREQRLWDSCLATTRPQLDTLAQRLQPKVSWQDVVLPDAQLRLLKQIADQVQKRSMVYDDWGFRNKTSRGLGISVLFAGESGTGKTMTAEVIANDLRLNLYRIDLSAVVSKYIGETEKNLRRLFDAAEDGGAILFFDEADALFGKRSEVKDSHDRYANIEINYLLQRMEAFRGLAILATNMKTALDQAFMRRLRFIVDFPFPGVAERKAMWQKVFPPEAPVDKLDFDRLARLNLTGGSIHNIALNAAFLSAHTGAPVSMDLVLDAARTEFRKLERSFNETEFRQSAKPIAVA